MKIYQILLVASKHVQVRKKPVLIGCIQSLEEAAVVDLIAFAQQFLEFLDLNNNFWRQVCCF